MLDTGVIVGGNIAHDCPNSRSIGYFLEAILPLAPFSKKAFNITFTGVTNSEEDISVRCEIATVQLILTKVDLLRTVTLPLLKEFGIEDIGLKIKKRGSAPDGGG